MRAKFSDLEYKAAATECCAKKNAPKEDWLTAERIPVKENYTAADLEGMEHLNYAAGYRTILAWSIFNNVRYASLDYPSVCRFLFCRGVKRLLSS